MKVRALMSAFFMFSSACGIVLQPVAQVEADEENRPIKGTAEGEVTEIVTPTDWIIDYVGSASHLGDFTRREWVTFNDDGTMQGEMTFVAANGDELNVDFTGFFVSPNEVVGTYIFSGGSGRFEGAGGTADFYASTPDFVHVSVVFEGSINY